MNKGSQRRQRRRYRVRYDRIGAVLLAVIVLMIAVKSCVSGILKSDDDGQPDSVDNFSVMTDSEQTENNSAVTEPTEEIVITATTENIITTAEQTAEFTLTTTATSEETTTTEESTTTTTVTYVKEKLPEGYRNIQVDSTQAYSGNLLLVNALHIYQFRTGDTDIVTLYDHIDNKYYGVSDLEVSLDSEVISHLNQFMQDFAETKNNTDIIVIGGYRSMEWQNQKYSEGTSYTLGGFSDYHTGRSFDMGVFPQDGSSSGYYSPTGVYAWIDEHASDYGFIVRYPDGKDNITGERARTQTYRYVGVPHSTYIKQNNLCLEEYIEKLKSYTISKPLEISSGKSLYNVYFVPSDYGQTTDIGVPESMEYEISGNNEDGFIVTVKVN